MRPGVGDVGDVGVGLGAPLGRGGRGMAGGGDGKETTDELLRIVELESDRFTSPLEKVASLNLV
jgi:hypothetical protein